jgi:hypothetical protein
VTQKVAKNASVPVFKTLDGLRIVLLQRIGQSVGEAGLVIGQAAALLNQAHELTHPDALRLQGLQFVAVVKERETPVRSRKSVA